jgi:hypothetical protein
MIVEGRVDVRSRRSIPDITTIRRDDGSAGIFDHLAEHGSGAATDG